MLESARFHESSAPTGLIKHLKERCPASLVNEKSQNWDGSLNEMPWISVKLIGERSATTGRRVHMHLLVTRYQRAWADRTFPQGLLRHLAEIGLVNERVSFAHGIYLRPDEMELIAERGATIVVNSTSNLVLSSGTAPVAEFLKRGCRVAMGPCSGRHPRRDRGKRLRQRRRERFMERNPLNFFSVTSSRTQLAGAAKRHCPVFICHRTQPWAHRADH
ncbi:amidohydrolase family protein [Aurantimonas sp. A2-1-M11]|uniref:amidohydrolase family protein n=1 Tax=Aurantimonas sp. A2-1-M11 TaxID=3113712 RepID=UPI002F927B3D